MAGLPLHHAVRNAARAPARSLLLVVSSALVAALLVATSAFVRSLEASHLGAAPDNTVLLVSNASMRDVLRSSLSPAVAELVAADVPGVLRFGGVPASSPEIHLMTSVELDGETSPMPASVRGVTERAFLVHEAVTLVSGRLPGAGEALVGRLAGSRSGAAEDALDIGSVVGIEGGEFVVSGTFAAPRTTIESEIWVPLGELQGLTQRDDCSCVFVRVESAEHLSAVDLFANRRLDLELVAIPAAQYYAELVSYFTPILALVWAMTALIAIAALTGGANTVISMVQERTRELATLRAIGYRTKALAWTVLQETLTLAMAGALLGMLAARLFLEHATMNVAMSAFAIEVGPLSVLTGLVGVIVITLLGASPALTRVLRLPLARALRES